MDASNMNLMIFPPAGRGPMLMSESFLVTILMDLPFMQSTPPGGVRRYSRRGQSVGVGNVVEVTHQQ